MKRWLFGLLAVLLVALPSLSPSVVSAQNNCRFFTETGSGQGGFSVCDDAQAKFLTTFNQYGLQNVGYPVSRRYMQDGFLTQAFQKAIFQWRTDGNYVAFTNVFDDLHNAGLDDRLLATRQTPKQLDPSFDAGLSFQEAVAKRQALLNERPALRSSYFSVSDPMLFFGLPTSAVQDMGNHYAIRMQRAVLQEWKEDVPWAKKGQVTVANGADIAKELGFLPDAAIVPEPVGSTPPPGGTPAPQPTPAPSGMGKILFTSTMSNDEGDCYSANADGSNVKRLTTIGCSEAHFTADGNTIVFEHNLDIWKMNADGSGQVPLTDNAEKPEAFPVVAANGKIAYLFAWAGGFEIYTMNLDGSDKKPLTARDFDIYPAWSPDSQWVAFTSLRSGSLNIWVINVNGTGLRQVTDFGPSRSAYAPVFSPDGSKIAFSLSTNDNPGEIWTINVDGSAAGKVLPAIGDDPDRSSYPAAWRGSQLLVAGYEGGNWDPYFLSQDGTGLTRLSLGSKDELPSDWRKP